MLNLRKYLNSISPGDQHDFAVRCGTSLGYLRKAISLNKRLGVSIAINIERESYGAISCESLRPDVDWKYIRNSCTTTSTSYAKQNDYSCDAAC